MNLPRDRGAAARAAEGRARFWILGSLVVLALVSLAVPAALGYLQSRRFDYCREPAEALETSRRIQEYFSANRDALARGALLLASPDTGVLNGDLRVLLRILEDDYLLEVPVHRRAAGDKGGVFSAHEWLAGEGSAPLRSRLAELANHDLLPIRSQAFRALSLIGLKVPESLSEAPFPAFRREHLRGLLVVAEGEPLPPGIEIRSFLREVLLSPMTLRLWQNAAQPGTAQSLALALRAVLALEDTSDGDLADAVCKSPDVDGPVRVLQAMALARAEDERAWRRLLRIAAADTAVPQRMAALEALRSCAPPEAIQGLRELASR